MPRKRAPEDKLSEGTEARKARTQDPGIRIQGGRIYDSETGTTCHQCRQKTIDAKAKCTSCTLYWCSRCLLNRYGEEVDKVILLAAWPCPRCRKACNCSSCRKRLGMAATGILAHVSKAAGFTSVGDLLKTNPSATALPKASKEEASAAGAASKPRKPKIPSIANLSEGLQKSAASSEPGLLPGTELPPRPHPMPELLPMQVPMVLSQALEAAPARKKRQGQSNCSSLQLCELHQDCNAGDLLEVLEFLQVFREELGLAQLQLGRLVAEILQVRTSQASLQTRHSNADPLATGQIAVALGSLLTLVSEDSQLPCGPSAAAWMSTVRTCLPLLRSAQPLACLATWGAAAEAKTGTAVNGSPTDDTENSSHAANNGAPPASTSTAALASKAQSGSQNARPAVSSTPAERVQLLHFLCMAALDTERLRGKISDALEGDEERAKKARQEAAAAKKEARLLWQQQREAAVAAAILRGEGAALSLEDSRKLLEQSGQAASAEPACEPRPQPEMPITAGGLVRSVPLGTDRDENRFWQLKGWAAAVQGVGACKASARGSSDAHRTTILVEHACSEPSKPCWEAAHGQPGQDATSRREPSKTEFAQDVKACQASEGGWLMTSSIQELAAAMDSRSAPEHHLIKALQPLTADQAAELPTRLDLACT
ncbi:hypothetical protein WJX74_000473 [Apatococcus lobatus]|uniref:Zinc-finger domain-containing protein n=1 Tax=Apatococcus lobatus TaxID=904363 RepID=A0AAW1Q6I8_9CHLO